MLNGKVCGEVALGEEGIHAEHDVLVEHLLGQIEVVVVDGAHEQLLSVVQLVPDLAEQEAKLTDVVVLDFD